jgi:hypothetical protein
MMEPFNKLQEYNNRIQSQSAQISDLERQLSALPLSGFSAKKIQEISNTIAILKAARSNNDLNREEPAKLLLNYLNIFFQEGCDRFYDADVIASLREAWEGLKNIEARGWSYIANHANIIFGGLVEINQKINNFFERIFPPAPGATFAPRMPLLVR